jgi:hypothetical protein
MAGVKLCENRSWPIHFRGRIGIHAAASPVGRGWHDIFECPRTVAPNESVDLDPAVYGVSVELPAWDRLPLGAILGTVEVFDCVRLEDLTKDNLWASGPWCWLLRAPRLLRTPVPCKGKLSLWEAPKGLRLR